MHPNGGTERNVPTDGREFALPRSDLGLVVAVCLALALFWSLRISRTEAFGWDESMHAELPAARMAVALGQGEVAVAFEALH